MHLISPSLQLLQVTPDVLCECFLQTGCLHISQHCFILLAYSFAFFKPFPDPDCMQNPIADITLSRVTTWYCSKQWRIGQRNWTRGGHKRVVRVTKVTQLGPEAELLLGLWERSPRR